MHIKVQVTNWSIAKVDNESMPLSVKSAMCLPLNVCGLVLDVNMILVLFYALGQSL